MAMRKGLGVPWGALRRSNPLERMVGLSDKWHPVVLRKRSFSKFTSDEPNFLKTGVVSMGRRNTQHKTHIH
jgi:hypothetical protein